MNRLLEARYGHDVEEARERILHLLGLERGSGMPSTVAFMLALGKLCHRLDLVEAELAALKKGGEA